MAERGRVLRSRSRFASCSCSPPFGGLPVFQDVSRLAFEDRAERVERRESHGLGFPRLDPREVDVGYAYSVCKLVNPDFALEHNSIERDVYHANPFKQPLCE